MRADVQPQTKLPDRQGQFILGNPDCTFQKTKEDAIMTTASISIEQQSLNLDSINYLAEALFIKVLDGVELELEELLSKEFEQGLPSDIIVML